MADARVAARRLPNESAHPLTVGRSKARVLAQREARTHVLFRFQWSPVFLCLVLLCSLWRAARFTEAGMTARRLTAEDVDGTLVSQIPDSERGIAEAEEDAGLTSEDPLLSRSADKNVLGPEDSSDEPVKDQSVRYAIETDAQRREETFSPNPDERSAGNGDSPVLISGEDAPSHAPEDSFRAVDFVSSNADAGEGGSAGDGGAPAHIPRDTPGVEETSLSLDDTAEKAAVDGSTSSPVPEDSRGARDAFTLNANDSEERSVVDESTPTAFLGDSSGAKEPLSFSEIDTIDGPALHDTTPVRAPGDSPKAENNVAFSAVDTGGMSSSSDVDTPILVPGVSSGAEGTSAPSTTDTRASLAPAKNRPIRIIEESSDDWSSEQDSESSASEESAGDSESDDDFAIGDSEEDTNETKDREPNSSAAERDFFLSRTDERSRGLFEEPAPAHAEKAENTDQRPRSPVAKARRRRAPRRGRRPKNGEKGRLHKGGKGRGKRKGGKDPAKTNGTSPATSGNGEGSIPVQAVSRAGMMSTFRMLGLRGKPATKLLKVHRGLVWLANVMMIWALPTAVWSREQLQYMREGNPSPQESALINVTAVIAVLALGLLINGYLENTNRFAAALNDPKLGLSKAERRIRKRKRVTVPVEEKMEEVADDQLQSAGATHLESVLNERP
ncbi:hypothetical protein CSUI_003417 [Cystoisospora suis]|uniref:Transmembrane protein n=1 Tax=Cystoisospora suis TaxID=483139 RepID=A0A2C6L5H7_9APIC|nr:hypothetical protein CSUI_003417 [Cystoisospora suis]